jgi:hypothetical protein
MPSPTPGRALVERAIGDGAHLVIDITRRTVAYGRPPTGSPLQRLTAPVFLAPLLVIMFALAAMMLVVMLVVAAFLSAVLALTAFFVRRRLPPPVGTGREPVQVCLSPRKARS